MSLKIKERMSIATLRDSNVHRVQMYYSGGGDDGCIDNIDAMDHADDIINSEQIKKALDNLEDYFYELLSNNIEHDWINNEGGNGNADFNLTDLSFKINHYQNFQENYEYENQIDGPSVITL